MGDVATIPNCPICGAARVFAFSAVLLGRHQVAYHRCPACGLLQTEKPWWLDEAYSRAISVLDTGLVKRNMEMVAKLPRLFTRLCDPHGRFVDVAGGTGLLTRMMRDVGFDFRWEDPYCANIHASGFEAAADVAPVEAVTAIEVLEHLHDPLAFIKDCQKRYRPKLMVFTTVLYPDEPPPWTWWYYLPSTGQHISFYQQRTIAKLAQACGMHAVCYRALQVLSQEPINLTTVRFLAGKWGWLMDRRVRRTMTSRTRPDLEALEAKLIAARQAGERSAHP